MAKPLAVLLRSRVASNTILSGNEMIEQEEREEDVEMPIHNDQETQQKILTSDVEWDMIALVKRKIVFSKRPMPMVNLSAHTM